MLDIIKHAAMDAVNNSQPCDIRFGTVDSISPLKVRISSDLILPESVLVVPEHLTDYSVTVNIGSVADEPVGEDESATEEIDERVLTIYNGLNVGDDVVLIKNQGGKKYLILDRI